MFHYLLFFSFVSPLLNKVNKVNKARQLYLIKKQRNNIFNNKFYVKILSNWKKKKKVILMMGLMKHKFVN